ncbi:MAG: branched-chain amino acid transaminase [Deltaproteobacteria bacterium]|nr:branched-chain amino acid transaminase [Deltaproteobacteria bacterium]
MAAAAPTLAKTEKIWMNGDFVAWDDAKVHILTHTLHYGLGVFEGIRFYRRADGRRAVFRLDEHIDRLFRSATMATIHIPMTESDLCRAVVETAKNSGLTDGYIRPVAYVSSGAMGLFAISNPIHVAIAAYGWGAYLGEDGLKRGIRARVSSYCRLHVNSAFSKGKICGNYVNSVLAKREAMASGYDEAILLDTNGYVAEASGENIFIIDGKRLVTPPLTQPILPGITRDTVLQLAKDLGIETEERLLMRSELYTAGELFLTGTAAEITPVREVDDRKIGSGEPGEFTKKLQSSFFEHVRGKETRHPGWLTFF